MDVDVGCRGGPSLGVLVPLFSFLKLEDLGPNNSFMSVCLSFLSWGTFLGNSTSDFSEIMHIAAYH